MNPAIKLLSAALASPARPNGIQPGGLENFIAIEKKCNSFNRYVSALFFNIKNVAALLWDNQQAQFPAPQFQGAKVSPIQNYNTPCNLL